MSFCLSVVSLASFIHIVFWNEKSLNCDFQIMTIIKENKRIKPTKYGRKKRRKFSNKIFKRKYSRNNIINFDKPFLRCVVISTYLTTPLVKPRDTSSNPHHHPQTRYITQYQHSCLFQLFTKSLMHNGTCRFYKLI